MILLLAGFMVGLALAGSPYKIGLLAAFLLFAAFNVLLSAGVRNLVERVFHQRRLREVLLIILICGTLLPQLLIWSDRARQAGRSVLLLVREFPLWILPSDAAARLATRTFTTSGLGVLVAMALAAGVFGYWQFRHGYQVAAFQVSSPPSPRRGRYTVVERFAQGLSRILPDPLGTLVEKEIKYLWRSPRFRLPFFMGFTFGVLAWVPIMRQWSHTWGAWLEQSAVSLVSLYAFLLLGPVMFLNRFGFDRGSARFYFWLPVRLSELLVAKNIATVVLAAFEVTLVTLACLLIGLEISLSHMAEAALVSAIALLYLLSVGNYMSIRFPAASNPDRISRAGAGHGLRAAVQFLLFPLSLIPLLAAFWVRYQLEATALAAGLFGSAAALGLILYAVTLSAVARYGERTREAFLAQLSQGEGPIATE
jgi:ABC-2 type transport system permease protein